MSALDVTDLPPLSDHHHSSVVPTYGASSCVAFVEPSSIAVTDLLSGGVRRVRSTVDGAVVNPGSSDVVAVRCTTQVQVFNLAMKTRLASVTLEERVEFVGWVDLKSLGVITGSSVYVVSGIGDVEGSGMRKVFDRAPSLRSHSCTNILGDSTERWYAMCCGPVCQLYSVQSSSSCVVDGDVASFHVLGDDSVLLLVSGDNMHVMRLPTDGGWVCQRITIPIGFSTDSHNRAVGVFALKRHDTRVSVVTSLGDVALVDVGSGVVLSRLTRCLGSDVLYCAAIMPPPSAVNNNAPLARLIVCSHNASIKMITVVGNAPLGGGNVVSQTTPNLSSFAATPPQPIRTENSNFQPQQNNLVATPTPQLSSTQDTATSINQLAQAISQISEENRKFREEVRSTLAEIQLDQRRLMALLGVTPK